MVEFLKAPKALPEHELTLEERARGGKFPDYIVSLRARVKTPEQQALFESLREEARELSEVLFEAYPDPWTYSEDKLTDIWQRAEQSLIEIANSARALAESHRGFNVGTTVIGLRDVRYPENPWVVLFDANTRPQTSMGPVRKHCGELHIMQRFDPERPETAFPEEKIHKVLALFVVGENKQDDDSHKEQVTLTPCKLCRDHMWKMSQKNKKKFQPAMSPETPVVTANARHLGLRKLQKVKDLHAFHGELPPEHEEIE